VDVIFQKGLKPCPLCGSAIEYQWPLCLDVDGQEQHVVQEILREHLDVEVFCSQHHRFEIRSPCALYFRHHEPHLVWLSQPENNSFPDIENTTQAAAVIRSAFRDVWRQRAHAPRFIAEFVNDDSSGAFVCRPFLPLLLKPDCFSTVIELSALLHQVQSAMDLPIDTFRSADIGTRLTAMIECYESLTECQPKLEHFHEITSLVTSIAAGAYFLLGDWHNAARHGTTALAIRTADAENLPLSASTRELVLSTVSPLRKGVAYALCKEERYEEAINVLEQDNVRGLALVCSARILLAKARAADRLPSYTLHDLEKAIRVFWAAETCFGDDDVEFPPTDEHANDFLNQIIKSRISRRRDAYSNLIGRLAFAARDYPDGGLEGWESQIYGTDEASKAVNALDNCELLAYIVDTRVSGFALTVTRTIGAATFASLDLPLLSSGALSTTGAEGLLSALDSNDADTLRARLTSLAPYLREAFRPVAELATRLGKTRIRLICIGNAFALPFCVAWSTISTTSSAGLPSTISLAYAFNASSLLDSCNSRDKTKEPFLPLLLAGDLGWARHEATIIRSFFSESLSPGVLQDVGDAVALDGSCNVANYSVADMVERLKSVPLNDSLAARESLKLCVQQRLAERASHDIGGVAKDRAIKWLALNKRLRSIVRDIAQSSTTHIVAHAYADRSRPLWSGIELDDDNIMLSRHILSASPWLNSGRLVVLCGCETGIFGWKSPQEAVGVAKAFAFANYGAIVASKWNVDDRATAALMVRFYELWCTGQYLVPEALQQSQDWLRDTTSRGFSAYFASFEASSDASLSAAGSALRVPYLFDEPDDRPFQHPYYWGAFYAIGS
jgi:hypothetical protein